MNEVDVKEWKDFKIGELFRIVPAKGKNSTLLNDGDDVAYIAASKENNGFNRMVSIDGFEDWISEGNWLQFIRIGDAAAGFCNYIRDDFIGMAGKSSCAYNPKMNEYSGLFIASVIQRVNAGKYSFKESWLGKKVTETVIRLPVISDGNPDWDYMEQYMKAVMDRQAHVIDSLTRISKEKHPVDVSAWGEFRVGELFENYHGSRLTVAERLDGDVPFLTAGFENQGVAGYVGNVVEIYHNSITIDMFGNCFYHAGNYAGDDNVYFFVNDIISEFSKLFVTSVIVKKLTGLYSYNRQFRQGDVDVLRIRLPVTSGGEPDWSYMEQYMRTVMDRQEHVVRCLARLQG